MRNSSKPYWRGGPFRLTIELPLSIPQCVGDEVIKMLKEFRDSCQEQSIIFDIANLAKHKWLDDHKHILEQSSDNTILFGSNFPDAYQSPGSSVTGQMSVKRLLKYLGPRGEFESQLAKMIIIFIYHLWDDNFRGRIANSLSISKNLVECDLMGDIRHIRNSIIHKDSVVEPTDLNHLKILPQIWNIETGKLVISKTMIHALMEQINALRIAIKPDL